MPGTKDGGILMGIIIYESKYKDQKCIVMDSGKLVVKILPLIGGKIQSIYDKDKNKEYLYQAQGENYIKSEYDSQFENGEFSGFDEMFPSISECFYPSGPWKGIKIPDHGEVWSLPWDYRIEDGQLFTYVYGVRFPYKLERKIEFIKDNSIRISYKAINLSNFDFEFLWAAHPLFNCCENTRILLPESVHEVINTVPGKRLGDFGKIHSWPVTHTPDGQKYDMSVVSPENPELYEKYYVLGELKEGWCALHDTGNGDVIGLSYPVDKVPYLGLWINEGGYAGQFNAALEPCIGAMDRLDTAKQWNQVGIIKAKSEVNWFLNIVFDTADFVGFIDAEGNLK